MTTFISSDIDQNYCDIMGLGFSELKTGTLNLPNVVGVLPPTMSPDEAVRSYLDRLCKRTKAYDAHFLSHAKASAKAILCYYPYIYCTAQGGATYFSHTDSVHHGYGHFTNTHIYTDKIGTASVYKLSPYAASTVAGTTTGAVKPGNANVNYWPYDALYASQSEMLKNKAQQDAVGQVDVILRERAMATVIKNYAKKDYLYAKSIMKPWSKITSLSVWYMPLYIIEVEYENRLYHGKIDARDAAKYVINGKLTSAASYEIKKYTAKANGFLRTAGKADKAAERAARAGAVAGKTGTVLLKIFLLAALIGQFSFSIYHCFVSFYHNGLFGKENRLIVPFVVFGIAMILFMLIFIRPKRRSIFFGEQSNQQGKKQYTVQSTNAKNDIILAISNYISSDTGNKPTLPEYKRPRKTVSVRWKKNTAMIATAIVIGVFTWFTTFILPGL